MEIILDGLYFIGVLASFAAGVWFLIVAFREGIGHGLLMLFCCSIYQIIFTITHWEVARRPFFTALIGYALTIGSNFLSLDSYQSNPAQEAQDLIANIFRVMNMMAEEDRVIME